MRAGRPGPAGSERHESVAGLYAATTSKSRPVAAPSSRSMTRPKINTSEPVHTLARMYGVSIGAGARRRQVPTVGWGLVGGGLMWGEGPVVATAFIGGLA